MNDYITFDGLRYATNAKNWRPSPMPLATSRVLASGAIDIIHGPTTLWLFSGEISCDVTSRGSGWGTVADLRTSLAKRQAFTLIDHFGSTYTIHAIGPFPERALSPMWDSTHNTVYVTVQFKGTKN